MVTKKVTLYMDVYPGQVSDFVAYSLPTTGTYGATRYRFEVEVEIPNPRDLGEVPAEKVA